jgi:hypothetical protein
VRPDGFLAVSLQMCQRGKFDEIKRKHEAGDIDIHERDGKK